MRFNWDAFRGTWSFDYKDNVVPKPYVGVPFISSPQREVTIEGTIERHVLTHPDDFSALRNWFQTGSKLVHCPVFDTLPIVAGDVGMGLVRLSSGKVVIRWDYKNVLRERYFGSFYLEAADLLLPSGVINPAIDLDADRRFYLDIRPKERGFKYQKRGIQYTIEAIDFFVVPWRGYFIP